METNLHLLSTEITQLLASNLQRPELCSLRLVCRGLYEKSLRNFTRLIHVLNTDFSAQSLQKLLVISESAHLAPHVRSLDFRANQEGALGRGFEWCRDTSGGLTNPLPSACGTLQDILKTKLTNCRSFRIENYDETEMPKETSWLTPGDMVFIISSIIVNINLQVTSFRIEGREGRFGRLSTERLLPESVHRGEENCMGLSSWGSLQSLILRVNLTVDQHDWALSLLQNTPEVRELSLRLDLGENEAFFPRLAALRPFRAIQCLSLECMTVDGKYLSRFLLQHGDILRGITLRFIEIVREGPNEEGDVSWETVFGRLIGQMHSLEQLSVLFLFERYSNEDRVRVVFPSLAAEDRYPVVPGSEEPEPGKGRLRADKRVMAMLKSPVQLRYKYYGGQRRPFGVAYEGKDMNNFLGILKRAKDIYMTST